MVQNAHVADAYQHEEARAGRYMDKLEPVGASVPCSDSILIDDVVLVTGLDELEIAGGDAVSLPTGLTRGLAYSRKSRSSRRTRHTS